MEPFEEEGIALDFGTIAARVRALYDEKMSPEAIAVLAREAGVPVPLGASVWDAKLVDRALTVYAAMQQSLHQQRSG